MNKPAEPSSSNRRDFIKTTSSATAASVLAGVAIPRVHSAVDDWTQVALVGAGGRGTGAAANAPLRYAHPLVMDEVAMAFPDLKIVMAHIGHPWHADCFVVVRKHPNVYADVSGQLYRPWSMYNGYRLAYEWGVMDKLLFASDWPLTTAQECIESLRGFNRFARDHRLPEVPDDALEGIIQRDSLTLLGLE